MLTAALPMRFRYSAGWSESTGFGLRPQALEESLVRGDWRDLVVRRCVIGGAERHPEDYRDNLAAWAVGRVSEASYDSPDAAVRGVVTWLDTDEARAVGRDVLRRWCRMQRGDYSSPVSLSLDLWSVRTCRDDALHRAGRGGGWAVDVHPQFIDLVPVAGIPGVRFLGPVRSAPATTPRRRGREAVFAS